MLEVPLLRFHLHLYTFILRNSSTCRYVSCLPTTLLYAVSSVWCLMVLFVRPDRSPPVHYGEASMRNGFGLKYIHKFFNLPYLLLQVGATIDVQSQCVLSLKSSTLTHLWFLAAIQTHPSSGALVSASNLLYATSFKPKTLVHLTSSTFVVRKTFFQSPLPCGRDDFFTAVLFMLPTNLSFPNLIFCFVTKRSKVRQEVHKSFFIILAFSPL